jgi:putative endonuclease
MVRCSDASFYVGIATDVEERVKRHNWGVGPEFTAKRRPVEWFGKNAAEAAKQRGQGKKKLRAGAGKRSLSLSLEEG